MIGNPGPILSLVAYTIKLGRGVTIFECTSCEHTVTTLDFDKSKGNTRTQAATALNQHAILEHRQKRVPDIHWFTRSSRY
jgi:hypothetical protein